MWMGISPLQDIGAEIEVSTNEKFLKINQNQAGQRVLEYKGMLEFLLDSRAYTKSFELHYGKGFPPLQLVFDATCLSKFQKDVCR